MEKVEESRSERNQCFLIFCLLLAFYALTRPLNHSESYDSITYALFAENFPLGSAPDPRNILFHAFNRFVHVASQWMGFKFRALELLTSVSIVAGALSVVLFARLMKSRFGVSSFSAWAGATFLGLTYGYWRYTGAAEVYVPSIFLILCSLSLILRFLDDEKSKWQTLILASLVSGLAVLYYQPNAIVLFIAIFVVFCSRSRFVSFVAYSAVGGVVVLAGIVASFVAIHGTIPTPGELSSFLSSRNGEFRESPAVPIAVVKSVLAFGHDLFSAHWTRTLDPVRHALDPIIPGCVYNFKVVAWAGKGIQHLTMIAALLFAPMLMLFLWINRVASREWKLARPRRGTLFLICWLGLMILIVGTIDPGSFEAWIPALVPFAGLLTVWVIEPCYRLGRQRTVTIFLLLMLAYNFFGGAAIWRNSDGDYFFHKTAWIRNELTEHDTVMLNEFDYRMVDYLCYYSKARVVHLHGSDRLTISRSHPDIHSVTVDEFMDRHQKEEFRLFVMDDLLSPSEEIKSCRYGEEKFLAATELANRVRQDAVLVNSGAFGKTYEIRPANRLK